MQSVCERFPCGDGEFCLKKGGVTCLSRNGCDRSRLRRCINLATLTCEGRDNDDSEEEEEEEEEAEEEDGDEEGKK